MAPVPVPPATTSSVSYAEIYAHLVERSVRVGDESHVIGSLLVLNLRFKLALEQTQRVMEWLLQHNHVQKKEGWMTIVLLSDRVEAPGMVA